MTPKATARIKATSRQRQSVAAVEVADANTDAAIKIVLSRIKDTLGVLKINKVRGRAGVGYTVLTRTSAGKAFVLRQILVANKFKQVVQSRSFTAFAKTVPVDGKEYQVYIKIVSGIPDIITVWFRF